MATSPDLIPDSYTLEVSSPGAERKPDPETAAEEVLRSGLPGRFLC